MSAAGSGPFRNRRSCWPSLFRKKNCFRCASAIGRVFAKYGEKKNRNTARLKHLINKIGYEEFQRRLADERAALEPESRWTDYLQNLNNTDEQPLRSPEFLQIRHSADPEFQKWYDSNVYGQRQAGYAMVTICLPLGDITSDQLRSLADIARKYTGKRFAPPWSRISCCAG